MVELEENKLDELQKSSNSTEILEEKQGFMSKSSQITLQITGAALFGALSLVFSALLAPIIPRVPGWGIAYIEGVELNIARATSLYRAQVIIE